MNSLALIQMLAFVALAGLAAHAAVRIRSGSPAGQRLLAFRSQSSARIGANNFTSPEAAWFLRLRAEQARHQRYGRPATAVAIHLGGPRGALARRAARRRAQDLLLARRIEGALRSTDIVRAGNDGIVRVLLTETDENGGGACIRRLAERVPAWGAEVGVASRLTAGWATTQTGRDLWAANRLAVARLRGTQAGWLRSGAVHRDGDGRFSRVAPADQVTGVDLGGDVSRPVPERDPRGWRS